MKETKLKTNRADDFSCKHSEDDIIQRISDLNHEQRMKVGEAIQKIRMSLGLSQEELAKRIGDSRQTVVNYEIYADTLKRGFKYLRFKKIALAFLSVSGLTITVASFSNFQ